MPTSQQEGVDEDGHPPAAWMVGNISYEHLAPGTLSKRLASSHGRKERRKHTETWQCNEVHFSLVFVASVGMLAAGCPIKQEEMVQLQLKTAAESRREPARAYAVPGGGDCARCEKMPRSIPVSDTSALRLTRMTKPATPTSTKS
eukprot:gnl/TRDRNA2_/TRDRNA2_165234_c0_seq1.p2 gnl/TRDRNA2_/TRDRNA2_165234_c0~~gnl/TRDRNA2_/TRDRNA2_165234_c0_seq1.p2  ORF type:complete len:145 (-),score=9.60 gnl/TRDRNA2_/TRDRNA2_165234_c0_seq1:421-855(-)